MKDSIASRYDAVYQQVNDLASSRIRNGDQIKLVVVTKKQPIEKCREVIDAGALYLGENYPEEATEKYRSEEYKKVQLHLIGHLQSRKAKLVHPIFSYWHTIDRFEIAEKVNFIYEKNGIKLNSLIEVNLTHETLKSGFCMADEEDEKLLFSDIAKMLNLPGLNLCGLMTMGYYPDTPETNRSIFRNCKLLLENIQERFRLEQFTELSMGTSGDYATAIEEGSTIVRIGEKIMGPRSSKESA